MGSRIERILDFARVNDSLYHSWLFRLFRDEFNPKELLSYFENASLSQFQATRRDSLAHSYAQHIAYSYYGRKHGGTASSGTVHYIICQQHLRRFTVVAEARPKPWHEKPNPFTLSSCDAKDMSISFSRPSSQPSAALCAPNAQHCDQAYNMRIKCTYVLKKGEEMHWRELWVTQGRKTPTHMRLCQMNSLADHVKGRDREYTLSRPHRFICAYLYKRTEEVKRNHYTICEEAGCEGCAGIKRIK